MTLMKEEPRAAAPAEVAEGIDTAQAAPRPAPLPKEATLAALMASVALAACGGGDAADDTVSPPATPAPGTTPTPTPGPAPTPRARPDLDCRSFRAPCGR